MGCAWHRWPMGAGTQTAKLCRPPPGKGGWGQGFLAQLFCFKTPLQFPDAAGAHTRTNTWLHNPRPSKLKAHRPTPRARKALKTHAPLARGPLCCGTMHAHMFARCRERYSILQGAGADV